LTFKINSFQLLYNHIIVDYSAQKSVLLKLNAMVLKSYQRLNNQRYWFTWF